MKPYFKDTIQLCTQKISYKSGEEIKEEPTIIVYNISCDVQPSNRDKIFSIYGYYIDCQYVVYIDNDDIQSYDSYLIDDNTIIQYDNDYYKISKLIKWHKHTELYIKSYKVK